MIEIKRVKFYFEQNVWESRIIIAYVIGEKTLSWHILSGINVNMEYVIKEKTLSCHMLLGRKLYQVTCNHGETLS